MITYGKVQGFFAAIGRQDPPPLINAGGESSRSKTRRERKSGFERELWDAYAVAIAISNGLLRPAPKTEPLG